MICFTHFQIFCAKMPLENPIPPFDFKELRNICAVLSIELLQNVVEKTKILFFLQCIEIQNEVKLFSNYHVLRS